MAAKAAMVALLKLCANLPLERKLPDGRGPAGMLGCFGCSGGILLRATRRILKEFLLKQGYHRGSGFRACKNSSLGSGFEGLRGFRVLFAGAGAGFAFCCSSSKESVSPTEGS